MKSTIIVDDEHLARRYLAKALTEIGADIDLVGEAQNIEEAKALIEDFKPDIVFLDINMPNGSGFDLLSQVNNQNFKVIFTTAYDQYAVKAIRFSAWDYLLKPVDLSELKAALDRISDEDSYAPYISTMHRDLLSQLKPPFSISKIALPAPDGLIIVKIEDIIRCEGYKNYTTFHLTNGKNHVVSKTLKEYDVLLREFGFIRVFQSHLVSIDHIVRYIRGQGGELIMADGATIPVSREKKDDLLKLLRK